jgi:hypothetical protein
MGNTAGDRVLEVDYPLVFGDAFSRTLEKKFRYIHPSGATTERNREKPLWFKGEMRKMKAREIFDSILDSLSKHLNGMQKITCAASQSRTRKKVFERL